MNEWAVGSNDWAERLCHSAPALPLPESALGSLSSVALSSAQVILSLPALSYFRQFVVLTSGSTILAGDYTETVAGIIKHGLMQAGETILKIELAIGVHPKSTPELITEIWSRDTALRECSIYLSNRFPSAILREVKSSGYAMQAISEQSLLHVAAVGSEMGMRHYGLTKLASDIENPGENITTFLFLLSTVNG